MLQISSGEKVTSSPFAPITLKKQDEEKSNKLTINKVITKLTVLKATHAKQGHISQSTFYSSAPSSEKQERSTFYSSAPSSEKQERSGRCPREHITAVRQHAGPDDHHRHPNHRTVRLRQNHARTKTQKKKLTTLK